MSQQPSQVQCEACHATFPIKAQAERVADGEIQYFTCPECGRRYDYARVTSEGLRIRADIRSLEATLKSNTDPRLRTRLDKLTDDYRAEVLPMTVVPQ